MSDNDRIKLVLRICVDIVNNNTKEDAAVIINNLIPWAGIGASPYTLNCIAQNCGKNKLEPVDASYDKDVKSCITDLYGRAVQDSYKLELLTAGLKAKRGKDVLRRLLEYDLPDRSVIDMIQYVGDSMWSDEWIDKIRFCYEYIKTTRNSGYDIISYFTPEHSAEAFYETCANLGCSRYDVKISLEWLRDPGWSSYHVKDFIYMLKMNPEFDWVKYINSRTPIFVLSECMFNIKRMTVERITEIIDFWRNCTPKLEYDLELQDNLLSDKDRRNQYTWYKDNYDCDGDELAAKIHGGNDYDAETIRRSNYFNNTSGTADFSGATSKMIGG